MKKPAQLVAIGTRLKMARKVRGYSQETIAHRLGMSKQQISAWETGRSEMTGSKIIMLSHILECDLGWLLLGQKRDRRTTRQTL
jgi:transcriptional regulator with XRE-family HTH domain